MSLSNVLVHLLSQQLIARNAVEPRLYFFFVSFFPKRPRASRVQAWLVNVLLRKKKAQKVSLASWSQLANDMEEEVLSRYQVKKEARCMYTGRGKSVRWVHQQVRQEESKLKALRRESARLLNEFSDVCKCSDVEGKDPAKDAGRNTKLPEAAESGS